MHMHSVQLRVVRYDGLPAACGAIWARVSLSDAKVAEISAACARDQDWRQRSSANKLLVARRAPVTTESAVIWTNADGQVLNHRLRLVSRPGPGKPATEICLVHIEADRFYLWNVIGTEKVRSVALKAHDLVTSLRSGNNLPGVRLLRQQAALV